MLNLSLSGCGFLAIYHIGVVSAFKEHAPDVLQNKISGCSAGSLVAACALCDCCLGQMVSYVLEIGLKARSYSLGPLHPSFNIVEILRNGLRRVLPVDAHKICSGRLHVSLTRWKDGKNWLVNKFDTREDLIQVSCGDAIGFVLLLHAVSFKALICSSFVPFWSGLVPPKFNGVYCWDGGLSDNNPVLDQHTVVVSPFGGDSDICPREESASYYALDLQGTNIQWSKENFYRLSKALFPPSPQVLKAMCFRGYKDAINFLKSRNLLSCSCQRILREKQTLQSLMGDDFSIYDDNGEEEDKEEDQSMFDSDEEHIEQYEKAAAEPLKYQEMPTPVCDILDAACADNKDSLINYMYNSQVSRAISIMLIPWTLPVEMSITFTKKLIDYLPKIDVPHDSKNLIDNMLVYVNLLIQKLTYDKYQYHARVSCKLCVLKAHQIDSKVGGLKFSLCYHSGNQNEHQHDHHHALDDIESQSQTTDQSSAQMLLQPPVLKQIEQPQAPQQQFLLPLQHDRTEKLCARHRLPSLCYSSSENTNSIITSTATGAQPPASKFLRRRKLASSNNLHPGSLSSSYSTTVNDMQDIQSSSLSSSYKTSKYFDRARTEKKLRRYKLYNNSNSNTNNSSNATLQNNNGSFSDSKSSLLLFSTSVPINIPKVTLQKASMSSFDDTESVLTMKESDSEEENDDAIECDDEENENVYDNKEFSLNKNYRLLRKKLKKINRRVGYEDNDAAIGGVTATVSTRPKSIESNKQMGGIKLPTASSITTINELSEINLDFSFLEDNEKNEQVLDVNKENSSSQNNNSQLDFDTYLDKLELNVFGSIDN